MGTRSFLVSPLLILVPYFSFSQNVGIGTPSPAGKLQVNHRSTTSNPSLVIFDSSTSSAGRISFLNSGGNRFWQFNTIVNNNVPSGSYMDIRTDSLFIMTLRSNGNVGINNLAPAYKLDVGGDGNIDGILRVNDRLGLGVTNPAEKLDVNGNINLTGVLKINGNAGAAGQVLTSNGTGDPQWKNAAYTNNTRFAFNIPNNTDESALSYTTIYNLNSADVTISGTSIFINKTGLYHFEGFTVNHISYTSPPPGLSITSSFIAGGQSYVIAANLPMDPVQSATNANYVKTLRFENDVYIFAPASIQLTRNLQAASGGWTLNSQLTYGKLTGYLISE